MTRLRITLDASASRMGGAATYLREVLPAWAASFPDDDLTIITPDDGSSRSGATAARLIRPRAGDTADVVVYAGNFLPVGERRPSVLLVRNPIYFSRHHAQRLWRSRRLKALAAVVLQRRLCLRSIGAATVACTPSLSMKHQVEDFDRDRGSSLTVLPHLATPSPTFSATASSYDAVYVTLPAIHKNYRVLIEAVSDLRRRGWLGSLHLVGDDSHRDVLNAKALSRLLNVEGFIVWHPPRADGESLYQLAPIALNPSIEESFGFGYHEAAAAKVPMLVADVPIAHERIGSCDRAIFVDPQDWMAWADRFVDVSNRLAGEVEALSPPSWSATVERLRRAAMFAAVARDPLKERSRC